MNVKARVLRPIWLAHSGFSLGHAHLGEHKPEPQARLEFGAI
jgi:hypothetical protein